MLGGKPGQGLLAIARLADVHSGLLQSDADDLADMEVIVDDKNAVASQVLSGYEAI